MKKVMIAVLWTLFIVTIILLIIILQNEGFSTIKTFKTTGRVDVLWEELISRRDISEILVHGDDLYIFYDDSGLVNVYSVDGIFQYGLQMCTSSNGRGDMTFSNGKLLVQTKCCAIYVFEGSELKEYAYINYTEYKQGTVNAKRYEELETYFSKPEDAEQRSESGKSFRVSEDRNTLLEKSSSGRYLPVSFLPQRSSWVKIIGILMLLFVTVATDLQKKT